MSTKVSNIRGYTIIPAPEQGLDVLDLPVCLQLTNLFYADIDVTEVEYLGVAITQCKEKNDKCALHKNATTDQVKSPKNSLLRHRDVGKTGKHFFASSASLKLESLTEREHVRHTPCRRSNSVNTKVIRRGSRRRTQLEELSEIELMKRSLLSKSFLNLPQREYCTRSSSQISVNKTNSARNMRSQSAKDLLVTHRTNSAYSVVETISDRGNVRTRASTLPSESNRLIEVECCKNIEDQKHSFSVNTTVSSFSNNNDVKSVSESEEFLQDNESKCHTFPISANNKDLVLHPLDRFFKRRLIEKRKKIRKFSFALFLCGCSKLKVFDK